MLHETPERREKAGALGVVAIRNPRGQDIPWERAALARFQPAMELLDPALAEAMTAIFNTSTFEEANAFCNRALTAAEQTLPAKLLEFGPAAQQPQTGGPQPHPVARGIQRWYDYHGPVAEVRGRAKQFRGKGVVCAAIGIASRPSCAATSGGGRIAASCTAGAAATGIGWCTIG